MLIGQSLGGKLKCSSTRLRAATPMGALRALPARIPSTRLAIASGFAGGTNQPVFPSTTNSGVPPTAVATTGIAAAIASRTTLGIPSV